MTAAFRAKSAIASDGRTARRNFIPRIAESRVLMIECTFLGEPMRRRGAEYGHLHVEEIAAASEEVDLAPREPQDSSSNEPTADMIGDPNSANTAANTPANTPG